MIKVSVSGIVLNEGYSSPPWPQIGQRCFHCYRTDERYWDWICLLPLDSPNFLQVWIYLPPSYYPSFWIRTGPYFDYRYMFYGTSDSCDRRKMQRNQLPVGGNTQYVGGHASLNWYSDDDDDGVLALGAKFGFDNNPKSFLEELPQGRFEYISRYARKQDASCIHIKHDLTP